MARVNLFDFTRSISNESVSHPDDKEVSLNAKTDLPKQVQEDTDKVEVDETIDAEASNTKTTTPGPTDGGGTGKADFQSAEKANTNMNVGDVAKNIARDQNGGRDIDTLPNKVSPKDNLSASDVRTSVEDHEETKLKTLDASGAEEITKADDMVMDLEGDEFEVVGITDAADKGISEADSIIAKTQELNKAAASVERYLGLLNRLDETGRAMSPELRQTISWALEAIDPELFFEERVALESFDPRAKVSLEASAMVETGTRTHHDEIDDGDDPGAVSKGLSAKLKKIVEAGIRMFWRAINAVVDAYNGLTANMPKLRDHLSDLRSKVKVLEGGVEFEMKGAQRLMVGDEFVGDSREAIDHVARTANELLMAWPNQLAKLIKDWQNGRSSIAIRDDEQDDANFGKLVFGITDVLERAFRGMQELNSKDGDLVPSGFINSKRLHWSGPLPGNRALYTGVNDRGTNMQRSELTKAVMIDFSAIPSAATHVGSIKVTSPTAGEAIAIIRELEKLTHFIEDAKKGMGEIKNMGKAAFNMAMFDKDGENSSTTSKVAAGTMIMGVAQATAESQNQFFGYLTGMIKAYMGFIHASIKADFGDGETIEGEATRVD